MMRKPTADWEKVGDRFYRKVKLYSEVFDPDLELENFVVAGAPYSGAVAIYRDDEKIQSFRSSHSGKSSINIYSCSGRLIRRINWDKGSIKSLGWSDDERLLVVTEDGTVRSYTSLESDFTPFTLGHGSEEHGVVACRFWSSGFVALLGNNNLVSVTRYDEPRPALLASPPRDQVVSWTVIPPAYTLSRSVEVLLAIGETIYVVDASESEDRGLQHGPFNHITVSPNGKFVAVYTEDGRVWVVSSDFTNKLSEYNSRSKTNPKDVQWCGNNAVVLAWEDEVHVVGPNGAATKFFYDAWVHLIPDFDGVRILTNEKCEFIQKVPDASEQVFRINSASPAAVLLEAADRLESKSPKADDMIQMIRPNLAEAVDLCVEAAGEEYSIHWQKQLLKAASFGKSVLDLYSSDDFVDMCETLRVLNAIRFYEVGLPLSHEQYRRLTPEKLIERLINRNEYLLALRISGYLKLPPDRIYVHWAIQKVRSSTEDEESICSLIVKKLKGKRCISFEEIARAAYSEGRDRLATELLNYEPRAGKQVPLLLNMKQDIIALDKAIESGDTDLVFHVLLQMKKELPLAVFFRTINTRPLASALVESSAVEQDRELLKDLFYQDDKRFEGSNLLLSEALEQKDLSSQIDKLKSASRLVQDSKEFTVHAKALDETQRLLRMQSVFENDVAPGFTGLSVNGTVHKLLDEGHNKRAQKVRDEFKVSERSWWWIRLRALVRKRDWTELEELGKVKKSPIGWEPFFNEILSAGSTRTAATFIPKCTTLTPQERIEMWVKCGFIVKAGEEAFKAKDVNSLHELKSKATGAAIHEIDRLISQLAPQRGR